MRRAVGIIFLFFLFSAAEGAEVPAGRPDPGVRVLIIGIDGASWKVINPLLGRGELPNLKRLIEGGVRARLRSIFPLSSPAIWTSLATGKLPREHGIKNFHATRRHLRAGRIWDVVSASGKTVGIFGWLATWPPDRVSGFIVPSWMAHGPEAYPPEFGFISAWGRNGGGLDLERAQAAGLSDRSRQLYLEFSRRFPALDPDELMFRYRMMELPVKTDLFRYLCTKYRPLLAAYVTSAVDHVSHLYWKFYQPERFIGVGTKEVERFGDFIPSVYRQVDRMVGEILADRDEQTAVIVVSDHGFQPAPCNAIREIDVDTLVRTLGWQGVEYIKLGVRSFLDISGSGLKREEATAALKAVRLSPGGEPVFRVSFEEESGDLVIEIRDNFGKEKSPGKVSIGTKKVPVDELLPLQPLWSGTHAVYGILIMNGPPFRRGVVLEAASVLDVAPTTMAALGYPIASDLGGRVLTEAFRPEFLKRFPPRPVASYGPPPALKAPPAGKKTIPDDVKNTLKSLGYL